MPIVLGCLPAKKPPQPVITSHQRPCDVITTLCAYWAWTVHLHKGPILVILGPGQESFRKVKVTLTLRGVILNPEN